MASVSSLPAQAGNSNVQAPTYLQGWTMAAQLSPFHKHGFRGELGERSLEAAPVLCGTKQRAAGQACRRGRGGKGAGRGFRGPGAPPRPPRAPPGQGQGSPAAHLHAPGNRASGPATRRSSGQTAQRSLAKIKRPPSPVNPEFRKASKGSLMHNSLSLYKTPPSLILL